jgi:predicted GH43/DUF377 family glycosyl hydrolase
MTWQVDPNDPIADLGLELSPPGPVPGSVIQDSDGAWMMFLWGIPAPDTRRSSIYVATAESPDGPWIADPAPVLEPGPADAWDNVALDFPSVVAVGDGFRMLYSAVGSDPESASIGLASSDDGMTWSREPGPVIVPGQCGAENVRYAAMPRLLTSDDGYLVLFEGDRMTAAARSQNLMDWECVVEHPVLTSQNVPGGSGGIHSLAAARDGERWMVLVESLVEGGSEMWLGEALDLE